MPRDIVNTIRLEILFQKGKEKNTSATDRAASVFYNKILPELERILDKQPTARPIRLDRLEIDLGNISEDAITETFAGLLSKKLSEYEAPTRNKTLKPLISEDTKNHSSERIENTKEILIYFLSSGMMPWFYENNPPQSIVEMMETLIQKKEKIFFEQLTEIIAFNQIAAVRYIMQFENNIHVRLIQAAKSETPLFILQFIREYLSLIRKNSTNEAIKFYTSFTDSIIRGNLLANFSSENFLTLLSEQKIISNKLQQEIQTVLQNKLEKFNWKENKWKENTVKKVSEVISQKEPQLLAKLIHQLISETEKEKEKTSGVKPAVSVNREEIATEKSMAVSNAGIVILCPFLSAFFTNLGLVKEKQFISRDKQMRCVQLLHYLACENQKTPEHLLVLPKLLCNYPLEMPVPASIHINKKEKKECEELRSTILSHWQALKSTSQKGLMETFFQRDASLRKDGRDWLLHVEKKGADILLEHLPWSFRVVKLPWNPFIIHVEW